MEFIYYTGRGLPPYLSHHSLPSVQLCFPHFYHCKGLLTRTLLSDYTGLGSTTTYLTLKDSRETEAKIQGCAKYSVITVPVPQKTQITIEEYMEFVNLSRTSYYVSFSEEAALDSGGKRAERSAKSAVMALDKCLTYQVSSKVLGNVQGGKYIESRRWCIREMKKRNVSGLILGGLYEMDNGLIIRELLREIEDELENYDKILVLSGAGRPLDIVFAAQSGFNHFETTWAFHLAAQGKALSFNTADYSISEDQIKDANYVEKCIDLNDSQFQYEKGPLVPGCPCIACTNHHRGYIFHLLKVKEMNAQTLLAAHNIQVFEGIKSFLNTLKSSNQLHTAFATFVTNFCILDITNLH